MVEICCGGFEDAVVAYENGADRIELNSALYLGGLTPSIGAFRLAKEHCPIPIICMVRPRGAGFYYSDLEYEVMKQDCRELLEAGADGIAFGFLTETVQICEERTGEFVELIHQYRKEAVFHRAIDCLADLENGVDKLIEQGVDRIMTSGGRRTAIEGQDNIRKLIKQYGECIESLPGSGIHAFNASDFMKKTGALQIHSSCRDWSEDITTETTHVTFSYDENEHRNSYEYVNGILVRELVQTVNRK